jgi:hypothetical protein
MIDFQEWQGTLVGYWATTLGLNFELIDPTSVVYLTESLLRNCLTSCGNPLWGTVDGILMSTETYGEIAGAITEMAEGIVEHGDSNNAASCNSVGLKCWRLKSVVMLPTPPKRRCGTKGPEIAVG